MIARHAVADPSRAFPEVDRRAEEDGHHGDAAPHENEQERPMLLPKAIVARAPLGYRIHRRGEARQSEQQREREHEPFRWHNRDVA